MLYYYGVRALGRSGRLAGLVLAQCPLGRLLHRSFGALQDVF
jgi:hypothetical protein